MRTPVALILAAALGLATSATLASACSQCMCGSPLPAAYLWGAEPERFRFGVEDRYLSKSNALVDEPGREEEREHRLSAYALWRPLEPLLLLGRMPYSFRELDERPVDGVHTTERNSGFSDFEVGAAWRVAQPKMGEARCCR